MADPNEPLINAIQALTDAMRESANTNNDPQKPSSGVQKLENELAKARKALETSFGQNVLMDIGKAMGHDAQGFATVVSMAGRTLGDALKMAANGIQQAARLSITAQEGVALEFSNQWQSIKTIFSFDANKIVKKEELFAAQDGITTALAGISSGLRVDPAKISDMVSEMRTGLRSQIIPTAETFKTLVTLGIKPTAGAMNELREATGRAAIGQNQMDVLNRNRFALQVFGTQLAKTTLDLERAGISITSAMAGAESYVTNLDGAVDAIAQLNQLGTSIDFGQLTMLQEFDPAAALQYMADRISPEQLQSSSFRALLKQLPGLDVEQLLNLKKLDENGRAFESSATKTLDSAAAAKMASGGLAWLAQTTSVVNGSFIQLIGGLAGTVVAYIKLNTVVDRLAASVAKVSGGLPPTGSAPVTDKFAGVKGGAGLGALVGAGIGITSGISTYNETGSLKKSIISAIGPLLGSLLGGLIGGALAPFSLGASLILTPMLIGLGASLGKSVTDSMVSSMDDGISTPEAGRTLTTSAGSFSLNPDDTVVAGTNIAGKPSSEQPQAVDMIPLMRKIDELIGVIKSANTTIQVPGMSQTVNRMQLVGVYTRDETVRSI